MLFTEALAQLKEGKPMRREAWETSEGYLKILPDMGYVWKIVTQPNPNAGNFIFSIADFDGCDWVEYVAPKPVVDAECAEAA
jgi:hypothetical protein